MLVLKDVLRPRLKPISSGGERVPTRQVPYRQQQVLSKSHTCFNISFIHKCLRISMNKCCFVIFLIRINVYCLNWSFEFHRVFEDVYSIDFNSIVRTAIIFLVFRNLCLFRLAVLHLAWVLHF